MEMDNRAQTEQERMPPVTMRIVETIVLELNPQKLCFSTLLRMGSPMSRAPSTSSP